MFVAWRDLRAARGRFTLIAGVVTLITVLVTFLSGLTGGLIAQNISALTSLDADRIVFSMPQHRTPTFADSAVTEDQAAQWAHQDGVSSVGPLGISTAKVTSPAGQQTVTLFGGRVAGGGPGPGRGHVTLGAGTADALNAGVGARIRIGDAAFVVDTVADSSSYSHLPVVHLSLADWRHLAAPISGPPPFATILVVRADGADYEAADRAAGTSSNGRLASLVALGSFRSEVGSLLLMVAMLFGISALVVGAFFTVWSIQRQPDVAVLKALGATNRMLALDSLGQAAVLLLLGVAVGTGVTAGLSTLAGAALPFVLSPVTTLLPGLITTVLGLAGAGLATRSVTHVDPLTALGGNR